MHCAECSGSFSELSHFDPPCPLNQADGKLLVSWLREFEKNLPGVDYRRIMIVSRFERGGRVQRGHLHLCMAGLPFDNYSDSLCRYAAKWWRQLCGGIADIHLYDLTRDGLGYMLKQPVATQPAYAEWDRPDRIDRLEELMPTLSDAIKRSRYVRDGAPRT